MQQFKHIFLSFFASDIKYFITFAKLKYILDILYFFN